MIISRNLSFSYPGRKPVFSGLDLSIQRGTYTALMGANGSGKTTFALIAKGLVRPSGGELAVDGIKFSDEKSRFEIMKHVGLVFQNPENTMVSTTVESELAFGLENLAVPRDEMHERIGETLSKFSLEHRRFANPTSLSGGEMQRLALASVMIMRPACLILDEPTSLLDPANRQNLLDIIRKTADDGTTVIHITHFDFEALKADRLIVFEEGSVISDGEPYKILEKTVGGKERAYFSVEGSCNAKKTYPRLHKSDSCNLDEETILSIENAGYVYEKGTPFEFKAIENISLTFPKRSSTVILGASGSGKTTLLEIASGVSEPSSGNIIAHKGIVRAMAFQFPEHYLFGDNVESYVAFGAENMGMSGDQIKDAVTGSLVSVGLDPVEYRLRDPFNLSGGEKRRVALAGVLAMNPGVLALDEPTAGLDRDGVFLFIECMEKYLENGGTLIFSTHDFEVACHLADRTAVLNNGGIESYGRTDEVFSSSEWLNQVNYRDSHIIQC